MIKLLSELTRGSHGTGIFWHMRKLPFFNKLLQACKAILAFFSYSFRGLNNKGKYCTYNYTMCMCVLKCSSQADKEGISWTAEPVTFCTKCEWRFFFLYKMAFKENMWISEGFYAVGLQRLSMFSKKASWTRSTCSTEGWWTQCSFKGSEQ